MLRIALGGLMLMTTACAPAPPSGEEGIPEYGAGRCDAARAQSLIGQPASQSLGAEALRLTGARAIRWIRPGDAVTMDYRTDRLNIDLDSRGRVKALRCG